MDHTELELRLSAACAVAREAGQIARARFLARDGAQVDFKGPHDYLTATDQEVERLVVARLGALFPADAFLGEEGGGSPGSGLGNHVWVIDPIDGTENFARGIPHFCVSIAFVVEGATTLGVVYDPMRDALFTARAGQGAFCNGAPMRVSTVTDPGRANIEVGWTKRRPMADYLQLLQSVTDTGASFRRVGSGTLGLVYVADGRLEGYVEHHINSWDAIAALLMVREAGGWTNDFLAGDGLTAGNAVVATTPALKDTLLRATGLIPGLP